jgi:hypothetical protein
MLQINLQIHLRASLAQQDQGVERKMAHGAQTECCSSIGYALFRMLSIIVLPFIAYKSGICKTIPPVRLIFLEKKKSPLIFSSLVSWFGELNFDSSGYLIQSCCQY